MIRVILRFPMEELHVFLHDSQNLFTFCESQKYFGSFVGRYRSLSSQLPQLFSFSSSIPRSTKYQVERVAQAQSLVTGPSRTS